MMWLRVEGFVIYNEYKEEIKITVNLKEWC